MSSFKAINLEQDDQFQEHEEHTRELQVEQGYKIYTLALNHYKHNQFDDAMKKFDELLEIEILKPDKFGFYAYNSPVVDKLRYLTYRNRGFLYYDHLKAEYSEMDNHSIVDNLLKAIESLITAISHDQADYKCTRLLLDLLRSFNSKKLQRWVLELELTKDNFILNSSVLLPQWKSLISSEMVIINDLKDNNLSEFLAALFEIDTKIPIANSELPPLLDKIQKMKREDETLFKELDVDEIELEEKTWETLTEHLETLLPSHKTSYNFSKNCDPYNDIEDPIESIFIKFQAKSSKTNKEKNVSDSSGIANSANSSKAQPKNETKNIETFYDLQEYKSTMNRAEVALGSKRSAEERPQRSSKRVREKAIEQEVDAKMNEVHDTFLNDLNSLLNPIGLNFFTPTQLSSLSFLQNIENLGLVTSDLYDCISKWSNKHSDLLKNTESKIESDQAHGLTNFVKILESTIFNSDNSISVDMLEDEHIDSFIDDVNSKKMHFQQVRFKLLKYLLRTFDDGVCLITDKLWTKNLYKMIEYFTLVLEDHIFDFLKPTPSSDISMAVSVFEILVNAFYGITKDITIRTLHNQRTSDLELQKSKLLKKIQRWDMMFFSSIKKSDIQKKLSTRYEWAAIHLAQAMHSSAQNTLIKKLTAFKLTVQQDEFISNCNYKNLPPISENDIENLVLKYQIIEGFQFSSSNTELRHIKSLIKVLSYKSTELTKIETAMLNFLNTCHIQVKLQLWTTIFNVLSSGMKDINLMEESFFSMLRTIDRFFKSLEYESLNSSQRQQVLLTIIGHITRITEMYSNSIYSLESSAIDRSEKDMKILVEYFQVFYAVINYEVICSKDFSLPSFFKRAVASSQRIKSLLIHWSIIISSHYSFLTSASPTYVSDICKLLWAFHSLFASYSFCDGSENAFLKYCERKLCFLDAPEVLSQIQQLLFCNYHLQLSSAEHSEVQLHDTKKCALDSDSALQLGKYLIRYQYGDSNPMLNLGGKTSMKQIFDVIVDVIGEPTYETNFLEKKNQCLLEEYLESSIEVTLIKSALHGQLDIDLVNTNTAYETIVRSDIVFVAAIQQFNIFTMRRKNNLARLSELDLTRNLLKADIIFNSKRFESWYLLGKCYSYVAEDDLTWTSDKLIALDKKKNIATFQRKSILCYLMAISTYKKKYENSLKQEVEESQSLLAEIFDSLGEAFVLSWFKPMLGLCFNKDNIQMLGMNDIGTIYQPNPTQYQTISEHNVTRTMLLCYNMVTKIIHDTVPTNLTTYWKAPLLTSKIKRKIGFKFDEYKHDLLDACFKAMKDKNNKSNFILEPHYLIISICYKLVAAKKLTVQKALEFMKSDNDCFQLEDAFWDNTVELTEPTFYLKCIELLEKLETYDKKKWYHKPKYRISTIYAYGLGDIDKAINTMEHMVFAESPNKALVTIWKPDYELPGKHFVYITQYIKLYLELLSKKKDFVKIGRVSRKLRKFGSSMLKSSEIQELASKFFAEIIHERFSISEKECVESFLPQLNYTVYTEISNKLVQEIGSFPVSNDIMEAFFETNDLRKGSYTQYDDLSIAFYFKYFFIPCVENSEDYVSTKDTIDLDSYIKGKKITNQPKKRVSKKECLEQISILLNKRKV